MDVNGVWGLGLFMLGVHRHAELEITHPESPCLFPETFSLGEAPAPHLTPLPELLSGRKEWRASSWEGDTAVQPQGELLQLFFTSPGIRVHAPRLQTALMLKLRMP